MARLQQETLWNQLSPAPSHTTYLCGVKVGRGKDLKTGPYLSRSQHICPRVGSSPQTHWLTLEKQTLSSPGYWGGVGKADERAQA